DSEGVLVLPDEGDTRIIVCRGDFDMDTLAPFIAVAQEAVADGGVRRIIIDVAQVTFADSSMLNVLLTTQRCGCLILVGRLQDQLARLLEVTGANTVFSVADSLDTARTQLLR
ncbi:STAS domain-containing protein, partial [Streptomyces sp. NPDC058622]|uniref:STAS domain-containing protein n=1 Tax=Streptomyces sp. NPDC058622 TaxID=3346562 RepID=UPI00364BFCA6